MAEGRIRRRHARTLRTVRKVAAQSGDDAARFVQLGALPTQVRDVGNLKFDIPVPDNVRVEWANSLKDWPQAQAADLDKQGLPATLVLKTTLEESEKIGHKWPVRYSIK